MNKFSAFVSFRAIRLWILSGLCLVLAGCGTINEMMGGNSEKNALSEMAWSYADAGIILNIEADPMLNESEGQPHMLTLVVVQIQDPSAFVQQTDSSEKIRDLLLAQSTPPDMLASKRLFVSPGEKRTYTLPRVEKARYVGLVAGYDQTEPNNAARFYQIGVQVDSSGLIIKNRTALPQPIEIHLNLGPQGIRVAPSKVFEAPEPTKPEAGLIQIHPIKTEEPIPATPESTLGKS